MRAPWAAQRGQLSRVAPRRRAVSRGQRGAAGAIERALADPAALEAAGARALERSARFTWDAIGRMIVRALFDGSTPGSPS